MVPVEVRSANRSVWHSLMRFRLERGDDEARVGLVLRPLRLGNHPPPARPRVQRRPEEVLEAPRRLTAGLRQELGLRQLGRDLGLEADLRPRRPKEKTNPP